MMERCNKTITVNGDKCTRRSVVLQLEVKEFIYTWKVKNVKRYETGYYIGTCLTSPIFYTGEENEFGWLIELYPCGSDIASKDYVSIRPVLFTNNTEDHKKEIFVTMSIVNKEGEGIVVRKIQLGPETGFSTIQNTNADDVVIMNGYLRQDFIFNENNGLIPNDELTIVFKMCVGHDIYEESGATYKPFVQDKLTARRSMEFDDFENLLETGNFSDVKLLVGSKEFLAHKCILSTRSRVFSAMFTHEMTEQIANTVNIPDIEPEVMQEVLRFIYVGKVKNLETLACDILAAADKYEIQGLKTVCEEVIIDCLDVDNVAAILHLVDRYDIEKLKASALEFVTTNRKDLAASQEFNKNLKLLSSSLLAEVIILLMLN